MIPHHASAIEMAEFALEKTNNPKIEKLQATSSRPRNARSLR